MDIAIVEAADRISRNWTFAEPGAIRPGDPRHLTMLGRVMLDTFNPYRPAVIPWPRLDEQARARLIGLPIWNIAVQTEGRARLRSHRGARAIQKIAARMNAVSDAAAKLPGTSRSDMSHT